MTQPIDPSTLVWVRLVTDTLTPTNQAFLNGVLMTFTSPWTPPAAGGQIAIGVYGYPREPLIPSTPITTTWEWVVQPAIDPVTAFIETLPGAGGWASQEAKIDYLEIARALLRKGIQPELAADYIQRGYYSAIQNGLAQQQA